jgi:hypothetical protein
MKARNAKFGLLDHDLVEGWDIFQSPPKKVSPIIGPFSLKLDSCENAKTIILQDLATY